MNKKGKKKNKKSDLVFLAIVTVIAVVLMFVFPDKQMLVMKSMKKFFMEMIVILPAVVILMGLFNEFVSNEMVVKYLSKSAGIKAIFFGIIMGSLPTGPLYVAFPMASVLLKKGASVSCIIAFLSAWACIKIPQEIIEIQFLGWKFMAARLILTIIFVIIMGLIIERLVDNKEEKEVIAEI